jgi:hypothetical protein
LIATLASATSTATASMSDAITTASGNTAAAAIASTAVPQPISATVAGRNPASYSRSNARKQPSVVP